MFINYIYPYLDLFRLEGTAPLLSVSHVYLMMRDLVALIEGT